MNMDKREEKTKKGFTKYDFDRPDKFSFENLRSLDSIANSFARNFSTNLSAYVRMPVEIEVTKVEQVPFGSDFLDKKGKDEYVFCITNFADKEQIVIQLDVGFVLCVHNKQLGGEFGMIEKVKKSITTMEKLTTEHLLEEYLYPPLTEAFRTIGSFRFEMNEIETDPQYSKVTVPQDMVALITFGVRLGTEQTKMQIAIPFLAIERYIEKLNVDNVLKHRQDETPEEQFHYLIDHLHQMKKEFEVELGEIEVSVKELIELEIGTTLVLGSIEDPVLCKVGGKPKFHGKIGSKDNKKAIKITGMVQENQIDRRMKGEISNE
jgi:flagellar motor switch protein FliM